MSTSIQHEDQDSFPDDYTAATEQHNLSQVEETNQEKKDMAWTLSRFDLRDTNKINTMPQTQTICPHGVTQKKISRRK